MAPFSGQHRQDLTVALVGFTSWAAVAWKLGRPGGGEADASKAEGLLALGAALLCLWPMVLGLASAASYTCWREWLVPAHLAVQHFIGLRFAPPTQDHQLLASPGWAQGFPLVFMASFCQPWLYLTFGACLQRTRLRTFLWTQPLLVAPMLWMGRSHCAAQLKATPQAPAHLLRIAGAMQRCSYWLPVGPLPAAGASGAAAAAAAARLDTPGGACLAVHLWLVIVLAYCLPAIVIHWLEAHEEQQGAQAPRKEGQQQRQQQRGSLPRAHRDLLLQRCPSALGSSAELLLAAFSAWLVVQLALPLIP